MLGKLFGFITLVSVSGVRFNGEARTRFLIGVSIKNKLFLLDIMAGFNECLCVHLGSKACGEAPLSFCDCRVVGENLLPHAFLPPQIEGCVNLFI